MTVFKRGKKIAILLCLQPNGSVAYVNTLWSSIVRQQDCFIDIPPQLYHYLKNIHPPQQIDTVLHTLIFHRPVLFEKLEFEAKLNLKRLYIFFEPLKVRKVVIWASCAKVTECVDLGYDVRGGTLLLGLSKKSPSYKLGFGCVQSRTQSPRSFRSVPRNERLWPQRLFGPF
jgi:hypothetical protein